MWKICRVTAPWRLGDWVGWVPFGDDWMIGQSFLVWVLKIGPGNPQSIALLCISPPKCGPMFGKTASVRSRKMGVKTLVEDPVSYEYRGNS